MAEPETGVRRPAVVGVDVGGTKVAAAVVDGVTVVERIERPTETTGAEALLDEIAALAREAAAQAGIELRAIGAGIPSQIDAASGTALASVNVPLTGVPVRDELGKRLGVPVFVDNDANCAALGDLGGAIGAALLALPGRGGGSLDG